MNFDDEEHRVKRILENGKHDTPQENISQNQSVDTNQETSQPQNADTNQETSQPQNADTDQDVIDVAPTNEQKNIDIPLDDGDISTGTTAYQSAGGDAPPPPPDSAQNPTSDGEPFIPPVAQAAKEKQEEEKEEPRMGILDHLGELRRTLTRCIIVVLLGFVACYGFAEQIYTFLATPLIVNLPEGSSLIYTSPQGAFFTYLKVSLMAAILLTTPFTFYQIWAFIAPGLYKEERHAVIPLAILSALFFLSGATFCYYMVFPVAFEFFMGFTTDTIIPMINVEEYLSFSIKLILAFGLVFEMPLFSYFLAKLGLVTPEKMRKHRKYAVLAIFIVAAILTPPDVFSQVLMAIPMYILYEISIYVAKAAQAKPKKTDEDDLSEKLSEKINNFK